MSETAEPAARRWDPIVKLTHWGIVIAVIGNALATAEGTVRAQLTRVYAKAGVSSQAALVSLFFDDLLDVDTLKF